MLNQMPHLDEEDGPWFKRRYADLEHGGGYFASDIYADNVAIRSPIQEIILNKETITSGLFFIKLIKNSESSRSSYSILILQTNPRDSTKANQI